jgi:Bacterial Ig-like domain (group 3)
MFRGRGKQLAVAILGCGLVSAASLVAVPLMASAQGTETSAVSVIAKPGTTVSGHGLTIVAKVTAVTGNADTVRNAAAVLPTGTVTFTISGSNSSSVSCKTSNVVIIKHAKAVCHVPVEQLLHVGSPYSILAEYSGDTNFASSTGGASVTVAEAATHMRFQVNAKPTSGTANTFTATVKAGPGGSDLSGHVLFSVSDTPSQSKSLRTCAGGDLQPIAVTGNVGTATCVLQAGWFIVPSATHMTPHPHGAWNVSASYGGDLNFLTSTGSKSGHSRS